MCRLLKTELGLCALGGGHGHRTHIILGCVVPAQTSSCLAGRMCAPHLLLLLLHTPHTLGQLVQRVFNGKQCGWLRCPVLRCWLGGCKVGAGAHESGERHQDSNNMYRRGCCMHECNKYKTYIHTHAHVYVFNIHTNRHRFAIICAHAWDTLVMILHHCVASDTTNVPALECMHVKAARHAQ